MNAPLSIEQLLPELDHTHPVARPTVDHVHNRQPGPLDAVRLHGLGARCGVPGAPQVVAVADDERAVPRPHQLLGRPRLTLPGEQRPAARPPGGATAEAGAHDSSPTR